MDRLDLEVGWEVDNNQLKAGMADSKKAIEGVGQSVDVVEKKVNDNLNTITKQANQTRGSFNGLQNSINQVTRELPAFTFSMQTGFVGISNNIAPVFDDIARLRKENAELVASGQKGVPIWKQLGGAIFSWNTLLSVGITLMTVYGKEIGNWMKSLVGAKNNVDALKASEESLNDVRKNSNKTYAESVSKIETYLSLARNEKNSMDQRQDAVRKIIALDKERLKGITLETIKTGEATKAINAYTEALKRQAMEKAVVDKRAELTTKLLDAQTESEDALRIAADARVKQQNQKFKFDPDEETATDARAKKKIDEYVKSVDKVKEAQKVINEFDKSASKFLGSVAVVDNSPSSSVRDKSYFQRVIDVAQEELNGLDKQSKDFPKKAAALKASIKNAQKELEAFSVPTDSSINKAATLYEQILESRGDALGKILDMEREYSSMLLSDDEKEKAALKQKFVDLRKIIDDANEDIQKYNKENGAKFKLIDVGLIAPIEATAGEQLDYAQTTARIQKQFAEEYKVFQAYEELKSSTSIEYADKRFADQLDKIKSFESRLASELAGIGTDGLNALEQKRADDLGKIQTGIADKRQADEDKRMADVLKAFLSYSQKREKIVKDSEENITRLTKEGLSEQAEVARKARDKELEELTRSEISDNDAFKNLETDLEKVGLGMSKKAIQIGRETVAKIIEGSKMTPAQKAKLAKEFDVYFDGLEKASNSQDFERVDSLLQGFGQLVEMSAKFDGTLESAFGTIGDMLGAAGSLAKTLGDAMGEFGKGMSNAGGYAAMIGAVFSIASSISAAFNSARESKNAENQKEIEHRNDRQLRATEAITKALQMQMELIGEIYGAERLDKYTATLESIKRNWQDINSQIDGRFKMTHDTKVNDLLKRLNNGESRDQILKSFSVTSKEWDYAYALFKAIDKGKFETFSKLPEDITKAREELAKLQFQANSGNVDDYTQKLIDQLQAQIDLYDQVAKNSGEEITGISFSSFLDDLEGIFAVGGEDIGKAFSKGFNKMMETQALQRLSREFLDEEGKKWYKMYEDMAADGIDDKELKALQSAYEKIGAEGEKRLKEIQDAMGYSPSSGGSGSGSLSTSGIERITEQSATEWIGIGRASLDVNKQHLNVSQKALEIWQGSRDLFVQMVKHQAAIEANTKVAADQLILAVGELKAINKNTGGRYGG